MSKSEHLKNVPKCPKIYFLKKLEKIFVFEYNYNARLYKNRKLIIVKE